MKTIKLEHVASGLVRDSGYSSISRSVRRSVKSCVEQAVDEFVYNKVGDHVEKPVENSVLGNVRRLALEQVQWRASQ